MIAIFGLGNPKEQYDNTPHNVGFMFLDELASVLQIEGDWHKNEKLKCVFKKTIFDNQEIFLIKPQTYMNDSGITVSRFVRFFKVKLDDIIVVHDDVDIQIGRIKMNYDRGSAGHKGLASIFSLLGERKFYRIRVGVLTDAVNAKDTYSFVLSKLSGEQLRILRDTMKKAITVMISHLSDFPKMQNYLNSIK